jgi:hypothetical protein
MRRPKPPHPNLKVALELPDSVHNGNQVEQPTPPGRADTHHQVEEQIELLLFHITLSLRPVQHFLGRIGPFTARLHAPPPINSQNY